MDTYSESKLSSGISRLSGRRTITTLCQTTPASALSTAPRWTERRSRHRGVNRDNFRKFKKMTIDKFDEFDEWIDGDRTMRYSPLNTDARKHLSGWAMRNTNNHNKKVLKKSCLGVFLCSKSCRSDTGEVTTVRPATSDKARQKQSEKVCPKPSCNGKLYHAACTGKGGYPATHFWRVTDQVILFQCKGTHDHPRPDVVKTTTAAKQALLEYHRRHRHERPKEICKKVGVYIHKSFSRVDRVARQLREVAAEQDQLPENLTSEGRTTPEDPSFSSVRASYPGAWTSPQKAEDAAGNHAAAVPSISASYYQPHQPDMYASLPMHETYSTYGNYNSNGHSPYNSYNPSMTSGYDENIAAGYDSPSSVSAMSPYMDVKPDMSYAYGYQTQKQSPRQAFVPACSPNQELPQVHATMQQHHRLDNRSDNSSAAVAATPVRSSYKRKGAPDLIPIEAKPSKFPKIEESVVLSPIKLGEHTPGINLDLSNFADIFDFSGLTQDEGLGLAGRPKSATLVSNDSTGNASTPAVNTNMEARDIERTKCKDSRVCISFDQATDTTTADSSSCNSPEQPEHLSPVPSSKSQYYPTSSDINTTLTTLDAHHSNTSHTTHYQPASGGQSLVSSTSGAQGDEESEGYINFLVRMYLGKDERQMSTLKSEFTVYTADLQKAYSNRNYGEPGHHYKSHNGQYEFSWYNTDTRNAVYQNIASPRNVSSRFEYPSNHSDYACYMGTRHDRPGY